MREIKYRAFIKRLKMIVPVARINFDVKTIEVDLSDGNGDYFEYDFDEVELMQYTGLKDKNDVKIYEGDIVSYTQRNLDKALGYDIRGEEYYVSIRAIKYSDQTFNVPQGFIQGLEVIGNIYKNQELLGK